MSNHPNEKLNRRRALRMIGAAGAAAVAAAACSTEASSPTSPSSSAGTTGGSSNTACAVTPSETVGPYPSLTDLTRSDVREGKPGTDLSLTVKVVNVNSSCAPVSGVVEVTRNNQSVKVTQMALPESVNNTVHTSGVYASRGANPTRNTADGIFADSLASEITTPTGSPSGGYTASFQVAISM